MTRTLAPPTCRFGCCRARWLLAWLEEGDDFADVGLGGVLEANLVARHGAGLVGKLDLDAVHEGVELWCRDAIGVDVDESDVVDVARLVSFGLAVVTTSNGKRIVRVTERGLAVAARLTSVYADGYRASVRQVAPRLGRLSDKALQNNLSRWLRADPMLFDLVDPDGSAGLSRLYDDQDLALGTWEQRDDE